MNETIIAWATHTLNVVHGCSKPAAIPAAGLEYYESLGLSIKKGDPHWKWTQSGTSPECVRCYAEHLSNQRGKYAVSQGKEPKGWTVKPWLEENEEENVHLHPERFKQIKSLELKPQDLPPSQRNRIFICSMGDIFHRKVPSEFLRELFYWMSCYPNIYMLLTKRPDIAAEFPGPWPANVWLGTTCGHPATKWRLDYLRRSNAKTRFVSMEPLLASMVTDEFGPLDLRGIHQVIVGGESGQGYRKMNMEWAREIRDLCANACTRKRHANGDCPAFFFKQDSDYTTERRCYLVEKDGRRFEYRQFPGELTPPVQVGEEAPGLKVIA